MDFSSLKKACSHLGIVQGDILYVASDVSSLLHEEIKEKRVLGQDDCKFFLDKFIDNLKEVVGDEGTLLFPVFTWSFCRGKGFDYIKSMGECGVLANRTLNRNDFIRTVHPMYSFCVWGRHARYLKNLNNLDSWGEDSPFAWLYRNKAKQLLINVSLQRGLTFMHYIEQKNTVQYRYKKEFSGLYRDEKGIVNVRTYFMYVRDLDKKPVNKISEDFLDQNSAAITMQFGNTRFKLVDLAKTYEVISKDIRENNARNIMYYEGGQ